MSLETDCFDEVKDSENVDGDHDEKRRFHSNALEEDKTFIHFEAATI